MPAGNDFDGWVALLGHGSTQAKAYNHLMAAGLQVLPAVRKGLDHPDPAVRRRCVNLLDHFVDDDTLPALIAAVDDSDPHVAGRALHALACDRCKEGECRPGEESWVPKALPLLDHRDPHLRASAIDALGKVIARRADVATALAHTARHDPDKGLRGMARHLIERSQITPSARSLSTASASSPSQSP